MARLIVGLGNPGSKYHETRHNVGFMFVDAMAAKYGLTFKVDKVFEAEVADTFIDGEKIYFVKPTTFMNESGRAVHALLSYYGLTARDVLVVYDDLDMATGKVRFRQQGSAGGHNGIKSLIKHLGTQDFDRIKIGIGRPAAGRTVINHVLTRFEGDDKMAIDLALEKLDDAVNFYLTEDDFAKIARRYNG